MNKRNYLYITEQWLSWTRY